MRTKMRRLWQTSGGRYFPTHLPGTILYGISRRKLTVQAELFFVAMKDQQLVGTAMAVYDGHRGWIYYVVVSPDHRRQGIGSALMGHAEEALRKMKCPKLNLQVRASNHEVVAFYRHLGYEIEERISMAKRLE